ncbi:uncharacterized protein E0L32_003448 [Thyridium curvatum]|uniref:AB hydrolase-1 domain-containing protein n=1 Tax=Thyridium curvatum TaxID=1093900 RepID=A0A507BCB2_9PEZI|nr:uncharacterized protein E0L32_003448 [Thyridium curvatum]TPX16886.1 hypothetical protein E0L32_003448 [Thyridium curvatum]
MAINKTTFVIVPGSFALPGFYDDNVVALLRERGYDARTIPLLSADDGTRQPPATMEQDAEHIRAVVLAILEDPQHPSDVVIASHSYSGIPVGTALAGLSKAARVAEGRQTAVVGVAAMASFLPALGQSARDLMGSQAPEPYRSGLPGEYFPPAPREILLMSFTGASPSAEQVGDRYLSFFTRHSSDSYGGKLGYEPWMDIPTVQIIPGMDVVIPTALQEQMHERAVGAGGKVKRVFVDGAGHAVNVIRPEAVVDEMVGLVDKSA